MRALKLKKISDYGIRSASGAYGFDAAPHLGGNIRGGDNATYYPELWRWLVERFSVTKVLDVGCGDGVNSGYFARLGCQIIGIEGLLPNVLHSQAPYPMIVHDFSHGWLQLAKIDLVWCCELLEHVHAKYLDNLIQTLLNGRLIALTHAEPGQGGHHHVNEQPAQYWIDLLADYGCELLEEETAFSRTLAHSWYANSGMLFNNTRWLECNDSRKVDELSEFTPRNEVENVLARFNRSIRQWQAEKLRILVYGAGQHTTFLLRHSSLGQANIIAVADKISGKEIPGLDCKSILPGEVAALSPDIIIISSLAYQDDIYQQLIEEGLEKDKLVKIYLPEEIPLVRPQLYRYL